MGKVDYSISLSTREDFQELNPDEMRGTLLLLAKHYPKLFGSMTALEFINNFFPLNMMRMSEEFSRTIKEALDVMYPVLNPITIEWPEHELLYGTPYSKT